MGAQNEIPEVMPEVPASVAEVMVTPGEQWQSNRFVSWDSCEDEDEVFRAAWVEATHWNGFASPWFTYEEARKIAVQSNKLHAEDQYSVYRFEFDPETFVFNAFDDNYPEEPEPIAFGAAMVDGVPMWGIGAWYWTWNDFTDIWERLTAGKLGAELAAEHMAEGKAEPVAWTVSPGVITGRVRNRLALPSLESDEGDVVDWFEDGYQSAAWPTPVTERRNA